MPDIFQRHADGVAAVQEYLGPSCPVFTWAGTDYRLSPSSAVRGNNMGLGGNELIADLSFVVLAAQLPNPGPKVDQTITYLGNSYRIRDIDTLPGGQLLRFKCDDANQGL